MDHLIRILLGIVPALVLFAIAAWLLFKLESAIQNTSHQCHKNKNCCHGAECCETRNLPEGDCAICGEGGK